MIQIHQRPNRAPNHYPDGRRRRLVIVAATTMATITIVSMACAQRPLIRLTVDGVPREGTPAAWSDSRVLLLGRDGQLRDISSSHVTAYEQLSAGFIPLGQREVRGQLQREFGRGFDVSGTGHYLVVHPAGKHDVWAPRFEQLYRSFTRHFTARGMRLNRPEFPLIAVVFPSRREFTEYAHRVGVDAAAGVIGFYSMHTNRVLLYDTAADSPEHDRTLNRETVMHEATHQIAFNLKVHSRYAGPPRWLAEGLAMMFEAPGVWDPAHHPRLADRISPSRFAAFLRFRNGAIPPIHLHDLVAQADDHFAANPAIAYAEAWAFSFFLSEKEPRKYVKYLAVTAARQPFQSVGRSRRVSEFTSVFGTNFDQLEARFMRFVDQLQVEAERRVR